MFKFPAAPSGAALFFAPPLALPAGEGVGQIPAPRPAQLLIRRPGHYPLVAEQPVQEGQLRVAALLYPFFISRMVFCR